MLKQMSGVILVIDELIDQGVVMHTDHKVILQRISTKKGPAAKEVSSTTEAPSSSNSGGGSLFASVFASARGALGKTMGM